jgi:cytochrome c peroxidase
MINLQVLILCALLSSKLLAGPLSADQKLAQSFLLPLKAPEPIDNPTTKSKVDLGRKLFFDPRLSVDGTVSCNSCHNVMASGSDNRPVSVGVKGQRGGRGAPTVFNAAFLSVQFWDGRASSLEEQAKGPLTNPIEMGMPSHDAVVERLRRTPGYPQLFAATFSGRDPLTIDNVAKAIAAFERTLITPNSAFDRWAKGQSGAISTAAKRGFHRMNELGCVSCHSGPAFAGPFLPSGTGFFQKFPTFSDNAYVRQYDLSSDVGRQKVTGNKEDANLFRVPSLRNIAITAPYFHNGHVTSLKDAIRVMGKTQLNQDLSSADVDDIYAFLLTLTGEIPYQVLPKLSMTPGTTLTPE